MLTTSRGHCLFNTLHVTLLMFFRQIDNLTELENVLNSIIFSQLSPNGCASYFYQVGFPIHRIIDQIRKLPTRTWKWNDTTIIFSAAVLSLHQSPQRAVGKVSLLVAFLRYSTFCWSQVVLWESTIWERARGSKKQYLELTPTNSTVSRWTTSISPYILCTIN